MRGALHRGSFVALSALMIAAGWALLLAWQASPYARYMPHSETAGLADFLCRAVPGGSILLPALGYVAGWVLMTAAMMLPTTLPLLAVFDRLTAARPDRVALGWLLILGYIGAWSAFGLAAHLADQGLHRLVDPVIWPGPDGRLAGAILLGLAGLYQFSALKRRCLDRCRSPMSFVLEHWRGQGERRQALLLGLRHGVYCVGCCWPLMAVMFVIGTGNFAVMLLLGTVMAAEKNLPGGRRLGMPMGAGLLAWAGLLVV